jgi:hypothetical protein
MADRTEQNRTGQAVQKSNCAFAGFDQLQFFLSSMTENAVFARIKTFCQTSYVIDTNLKKILRMH